MLSIISPETNKIVFPKLELVRFALPRRTYTYSHLLYVIDIIKLVYNKSKEIRGIKIVDAPNLLKHFSASFEWL